MTDTSKEAAWDALMNYQQADEEGIMVLVSRQAIHECKDERDALRAQLQAARDALTEISSALDGEPEYHDHGMGCGLEDRNITDRYDAMAFGWDKAMERIYSEHVNYALETAVDALKSTSAEGEG